MLWKKEFGQSDALYVDIFTPNVQCWNSIINSRLQKIDQTPHPEKSNAIALEKRNFGNDIFRTSAPIEAMIYYGDSLRFAKPDSEHISLAYANRAACFLSLKMYDECLTDIEYALAAGYPEHLRSKLKDRKAKCLKEMQESPPHPREKLNIEPDEKFPCLSNMAKIQRNDREDDYSMVANRDIDVGQLIVAEDVYHAYVMHSFGMYCNICAKDFCNLVPCKKCAVAMFCPECQGHFLHEYECGLNFCGENEFNSDVMHLIRGILLAMKMFATADELMVFVEQMLKRPNELPESLLDDRSKYRAYFNRAIEQNIDSLDQIGSIIYPAYKTLLRIPHVNEMFKTTEHRRFLMHLTGHHAKTLYKIAGFILDVGLPGPLYQPIRYSPVMSSYIKHSCYPNVEFLISGGKCNLYSIKPIRKGEQLFTTSGPSEMNSTKDRKAFLLDMFKINCECLRCQGKTASSAERRQLVSDPAYHFIEEFNIKEAERLMDACVTVLQKYGRLNWCDELAYVHQHFRSLYMIRSMAGGLDFKHPLIRGLLLRLRI